MDKTGAMTKNVKEAAVNYPPVREVEFGCEITQSSGKLPRFRNKFFIE